MDHKQVRAMKVVLLVSSVASLLLLAISAYDENFSGEWRSHQGRYKTLLVNTAEGESARRVAATFPIEHKQLYLAELGSIDRCTTCHLGVENPAAEGAEPPLARHPGHLLASHPVDKFGCTVCHQGRGRATSVEAAHQRFSDGTALPHADSPLLAGQAVYTSCGKCHHEIDLYGGEADLFAGASQRFSETDAASSGAGMTEQELTRTLSGSTWLAQGKALVVESGCLGCHKYRGRGGVLGPELTYVGDKTKHDFDFRHVKGEHTVEQWLFEHFKFPKEVSPDTLMPDIGLSDLDARTLALYMMSLHRKSAPASHTPRPPSTDFAHGSIRGQTLYAMFCSACHGSDGYGTTLRAGLWPSDADPWGRNWDARDVVIERRGDMEVLVPSLNHSDTLAVASDEYLHRIIRAGRPGTNMLGWLGEGGLTEDEITLLVSFIRRWQPQLPDLSEVASVRGEAWVGGALYRANCSACHGVEGEGGIGVRLNAPTFLAVASDAFLRDSIVHGRPNTAMPAWRQFDSQELSDLLAYIRQWQPRRSEREAVLERCAGAETPDVSAEIGRTLYKANCVMCHGEDGVGDLAPTLNTQAFLSVVPDRYLVETMIEGRPDTGMPSWRHLSSNDVASIVRYIRTWQTVESRTAQWHQTEVRRGDIDGGKLLFQGHCSSCHGNGGEGATGPQLNNPIFLRTATDIMLREWITHGKGGTEMRGFRKGGQGISELSERQIEDLVSYIRSFERMERSEMVTVAKSPHGRPEKGAAIYAVNCVGCHGVRGEGESGPALSNRNFLRFASDGFLMATMALGRSGTEMRPVKRGPQSILGLTSDQVNDVVAYLRSWEYASPFSGEDVLAAGGGSATSTIPHRFVIPWDLGRGKSLYRSNCSGCHGSDGKGSWAPELNNPGFLAAATDGFLQATIIRGRSGTAMRPFGRGAHGLAELSSDDVDDVVAYIRFAWGRSPLAPSPMTIPAKQSLSPERQADSAAHAKPSDHESNSRRANPTGRTSSKRVFNKFFPSRARKEAVRLNGRTTAPSRSRLGQKTASYTRSKTSEKNPSALAVVPHAQGE